MKDFFEELRLAREGDEETKPLLEHERERVARDEHPFTDEELKKLACGGMRSGSPSFELHLRVCPKCRTVYTVHREIALGLKKRQARKLSRR